MTTNSPNKQSDEAVEEILGHLMFQHGQDGLGTTVPKARYEATQALNAYYRKLVKQALPERATDENLPELTKHEQRAYNLALGDYLINLQTLLGEEK